MTAWLRKRRTPPPSDRSSEIGELAADVRRSRSDAEERRIRAARQAERVHRIHTALTKEGAVDDFTKKWADAVYRGGAT